MTDSVRRGEQGGQRPERLISVAASGLDMDVERQEPREITHRAGRVENGAEPLLELDRKAALSRLARGGQDRLQRRIVSGQELLCRRELAVTAIRPKQCAVAITHIRSPLRIFVHPN